MEERERYGYGIFLEKESSCIMDNVSFGVDYSYDIYQRDLFSGGWRTVCGNDKLWFAFPSERAFCICSSAIFYDFRGDFSETMNNIL